MVSKLNGGATTIHCLTYVACPDGEHGKINGYQKFTGSDADIAYMLQMRQNQIHYISCLIDVFDPRLHSFQQRVEQRCTHGEILWGERAKLSGARVDNH